MGVRVSCHRENAVIPNPPLALFALFRFDDANWAHGQTTTDDHWSIQKYQYAQRVTVFGKCRGDKSKTIPEGHALWHDAGQPKRGHIVIILGDPLVFRPLRCQKIYPGEGAAIMEPIQDSTISPVSIRTEAISLSRTTGWGLVALLPSFGLLLM
jgi:hypothetical protein